jgi:hypothetical protein
MRLLALLLLVSFSAYALPPDARVPVLTYHSWANYHDETTGACDTEAQALLRDLRVIHEEGFHIIPAYWLVEWVRGWRDGSTLPDRAVVITLDDGHDLDFLDNAMPFHPCAPLRSMRSVLEEAAKWGWGGRKLPIHATVFVIGSPEARRHINPRYMHDNWWPAAAHHPMLEIQNHSLDHDHIRIPGGVYDEALDIPLTAGGGAGQGTSLRIDTLDEHIAYVEASTYWIWHKTNTGADLFAYPFGPASEYSKTVYFPGQQDTHGAFCASGGYVTRQSDPWCLERVVHRAPDSHGGWSSADGMRRILKAAKAGHG